MNLREGAQVIYDLLLFIGMTIIYLIETLVLKLIPRRYRAKSIKGEIALITGGASGIGKLIAIKLAKLGAHVVIWDINKNGLEETVEEIRKAGGICHLYCCDITDKEEVYRTAKAVKIEVGNFFCRSGIYVSLLRVNSRLGSLVKDSKSVANKIPDELTCNPEFDGIIAADPPTVLLRVSLLVNNAGYVCGKTFIELSDHEIERTFKVNILSHYWITKSFLKDMMKNNHGHIVTVASVAGFVGNYNMTDYSATKFAAIGHHESLFTELKVHNFDKIHMTLVCPYVIKTGMFHGVKSRLMPILEPEYVAEKVVVGVLVNEPLIILPNIFTYLLPFKCLIPSKVWWALIYHIFKAPQSMMTFKGRESNEIMNE